MSISRYWRRYPQICAASVLLGALLVLAPAWRWLANRPSWGSVAAIVAMGATWWRLTDLVTAAANRQSRRNDEEDGL